MFISVDNEQKSQNPKGKKRKERIALDAQARLFLFPMMDGANWTSCRFMFSLGRDKRASTTHKKEAADSLPRPGKIQIIKKYKFWTWRNRS
jgi:hypothetical protein